MLVMAKSMVVIIIDEVTVLTAQYSDGISVERVTQHLVKSKLTSGEQVSNH